MAGAADAVGLLKAGAAILASVLAPAGFTFHLIDCGHSSGGAFVAGRFTKETQHLELHFRHSLGLVTYGWGDSVISHADYLHGLGAVGRYPGYSDDALEAFRHLALDLAGPLSGFRDGDHRGYEAGLEAAQKPRGRQLP